MPAPRYTPHHADPFPANDPTSPYAMMAKMPIDIHPDRLDPLTDVERRVAVRFPWPDRRLQPNGKYPHTAFSWWMFFRYYHGG